MIEFTINEIGHITIVSSGDSDYHDGQYLQTDYDILEFAETLGFRHTPLIYENQTVIDTESLYQFLENYEGLL